ncbi:MAG: diiron oxygenase [Myxococcales bacterium]|nr:diiron oxygenase [Myxococcales bacterium]
MRYSYASIIQDAQKARWKIDDVLASVHDIDFGRMLLPDALVRVDQLSFLGPDQRRCANQVRAHAYLQLFALVERFILPFVMMHAGSALHSSSEELLALMQFGEEEAKHITLFERFSEAFEFGFGSVCEIIGPADEIAGTVLAEPPLAVALITLHIEWMTQEHYLRSVRGDPSMDPRFKELLRAHWVEEAQHARLDTLLINRMVSDRSQRERDQAIAAYLRIIETFRRGLRSQVELDLEAYSRAAGSLEDAHRDEWRACQRAAYNEAFLSVGMTHPRVLAVLDQHFPGGASRVRKRAAELVG